MDKLIIKASLNDGLLLVETDGSLGDDNAFTYTRHSGGEGFQSNDDSQKGSQQLLAQKIASAIEQFTQPTENKVETPNQTEVIELADGKYTFILRYNGEMEALRYGEPWRKKDLVGDNLVFSLADEVVTLKEQIAALQKENEELQQDTGPSPR
jgi:hypothetical protein